MLDVVCGGSSLLVMIVCPGLIALCIVDINSEGVKVMKVRTTFIHPTKGIQDATIENAPSAEDVKSKLEEIGCSVLTAEEEK